MFNTAVQSITTPPDRDVTFRCTADGNPAPTYAWIRSGGVSLPQDALQSSATGELRLFGVTRSAAGSYTCSARNSLGTAISTATLTVLCKL